MPGRQILDLANILAEVRHNELITWIAAGFAELLADIGQRVDADRLGLKAFDLHLLDQFGLGDQVVDGHAERLCDLLDDRVRLGMNSRHVERIFAAADAEKAGGLLEGLRTEAGHRRQLDARAKAAMLVAVLDDLVRSAFVDAGDVAKQRPRRGIQIDANPIDARLNRAFQALHQLLLFDIVLILTDADRLRIDLHQLRERILQAAADGDRARARSGRDRGTPDARCRMRSRPKRPIRSRRH